MEAELNCDLSVGCQQDEFVVIDGDPGSTVTCTVASMGQTGLAMGETFAIQMELLVDGSATKDPSAQFSLVGIVSKTGGNASINESNSIATGGGTDPGCALTIESPHGVVNPGAIWASFDCTNFRDPTDISDTACELKGQFLFENCQH